MNSQVKDNYKKTIYDMNLNIISLNNKLDKIINNRPSYNTYGTFDNKSDILSKIDDKFLLMFITLTALLFCNSMIIICVVYKNN